jgi:4-hydroxybenzoate polyprenyltransferase
VLTAGFFLAVGMTGGFHIAYWTGYGAAVALLVIEQALVSARDISKINVAFMTANGLIGLVFGLLAIADIVG